MKGPVTRKPQTALRREQLPLRAPHDQSRRSLTPQESGPEAQKPASHKAVITVMTGPNLKLQTIVFLRKPLAGFGI